MPPHCPFLFAFDMTRGLLPPHLSFFTTYVVIIDNTIVLEFNLIYGPSSDWTWTGPSGPGPWPVISGPNIKTRPLRHVLYIRRVEDIDCPQSVLGQD